MKPFTKDVARRWFSAAVAVAAGVCTFAALLGYLAGVISHFGAPPQQILGFAVASVLLVAVAGCVRSRKPTISDFSIAAQQMAGGCGGALVLYIVAAILYSLLGY